MLHRIREGKLEVLLVHPGGPFWAKRNEGAWSIPKGEIEPGETALDVARREFEEELGASAPDGELTSLGTIRQAGGKIVHAWSAPGDLDAATAQSVTFSMEWPPRSGRMQEFPEVDRAAWFDLGEARRMILPSQLPLLDRLPSHE